MSNNSFSRVQGRFRRLAPALLLPLALFAEDQRGRRVEQSSTETLAFAESGTLQIDDSFGEVHVEAWDRTEVQIAIQRSTQRRYEPDQEWKGRSELERVRIETRRVGYDRIELRTRFPKRGPFRMFGGKTNVRLVYTIRVPRRTNLRIRHNIGEVRVSGVLGDHDVTADIGEIELRLPKDGEYHFDARAKIGEVSSAFQGRERRAHLLGATFRTPYRSSGHRVYARVGIGEVNIQPLGTE
jgi:hypothetical protein